MRMVFGFRANSLSTVFIAFASLSPGSPVIICKPSSKPYARINRAVFSTSFAVCPRRLSSNTSPSIDCAPSSIAVTPYCFNTVRRSSSMASGRVEQRIPAKPYVSHAACAIFKSDQTVIGVDCREAAAEKCDLGVLHALPHLLCCALQQRRHFFRLRLMIFTCNAVLITEAALLRAAVVRNKN